MSILRRWFGVVACAAVVGLCGLSGCGLFGGTDGGTNGDGGSASQDLSVPIDMTVLPPDMTAPFVGISWYLVVDNDPNDPMHGFNIACDDPKATATQLVFTVKGPKATASTTIPCPAGMYHGQAQLAVPDGDSGPYEVTGTLVGKPQSQGDPVCCVPPFAEITPMVYLLGCGMNCGTCAGKMCP